MIKLRIILGFVFFWLPFLVSSQSIINTVHNLSTSGTGDIKATSESEICIFCHTPHGSKPLSPLWNRDDPGVVYTLYNSTTTDASLGQPDGSSILCLSCHDGTIAIGNVYTKTIDISLVSGITFMPIGNSNLSTDLRDDHPISFLFNSALASADGELKDPASITWSVKLENDKVQCTSCHDPHKNTYTKFLVTTSQNSELCISCHNRDYWTGSSHSTSNATWNGSGTNPWTNSEYSTVAENACENCHKNHNAGSSDLLMKYGIEENNCLDCHNGNVASTNIETQLSKAYTHNVYNYSEVHDANEGGLVLTQHVECEDCHNPHAVRNNADDAPNVQGFNEGVIGINQLGNEVNPAIYEYEICYRCHADSPTKPASATARVIVQNNVRLEFDTGNPSYHPVTGAGASADVPSLLSQLSVSSIIYCTDCHASNGSGSPAGPHGSIYPSILKYQYETADNTTESVASYELCYSCHSRTSILNDDSFPYHYKHIVEENSACNTCHDPHGISSLDGNSTNNTHLINFDVSVVSGIRRFTDLGYRSGYCQLNCHGKGHGFGMSY